MDKMTGIYDFIYLIVGEPIDPMQAILCYIFALTIGFILFVAIIDIFYVVSRIWWK